MATASKWTWRSWSRKPRQLRVRSDRAAGRFCRSLGFFQRVTPMQLDVRSIESPSAREFYIAARPNGDGSSKLTRAAFESIGNFLRKENATIWQERIFAPAAYIPELRQRRRDAYGSSDDIAEPS